MKMTLSAGIGVLTLLGGTCAYAQQMNIEPVFNAPAPAPVYVAPYPDSYDPEHRRHDFNYWERIEHPEAFRNSERQ